MSKKNWGNIILFLGVVIAIALQFLLESPFRSFTIAAFFVLIYLVERFFYETPFSWKRLILWLSVIVVVLANALSK